MKAPVRPSERELHDVPYVDVAPTSTGTIPPPPPLASVVGFDAPAHGLPATTPRVPVAPGSGFPPPAFPPPTVTAAAPMPAALTAVESPVPALVPSPEPPASEIAVSNVAVDVAVDIAVAEPVEAPTPPVLTPTLAAIPAAVPTPPSGPTGHHPTQVGPQSAADWLNANTPAATNVRPRKAKSAPGRGVMRTLMVAVLAVAIGAGARIGYDRYQTRDDVARPARPVVDGNALSAWPNIAPPAIRYTETETIINADVGSRTLTTHRDLTTGNRIVNVVETDLAGAVVSYDLDIRADQAFLRATPDAAWEPVTVDSAVGLLGDEMLTAVFTVSDLFPSQATPYITVLENVDRQFSLGTIRQNAIVTDTIVAEDPVVEPVVDPAPIVTPGGTVPTPVTHYRVIIDTEAFRAAEGAAFQTWERQLDRVASPRLEVWVDADGVVRQIVFEVEGAQVTQKLVAGSPVSDRFEARTPGVIDAVDPSGASSDGEVGG